MRGLMLIVVAAVLIAAGGAAQAGACKAGDPTGRFEGKAEAKGVGTWDIVFDLRCERGAYGGHIQSPIGDFDAKDARLDGGQVKVTFAPGVVLSELALTPAGDDLAGAFRAWTVRGT